MCVSVQCVYENVSCLWVHVYECVSVVGMCLCCVCMYAYVCTCMCASVCVYKLHQSTSTEAPFHPPEWCALRRGCYQRSISSASPHSTLCLLSKASPVRLRSPGYHMEPLLCLKPVGSGQGTSLWVSVSWSGSPFSLDQVWVQVDHGCNKNP